MNVRASSMTKSIVLHMLTLLLVTTFAGSGAAAEGSVVMLVSPGQIDEAGPVISSVQYHLREIDVDLHLSKQDFPSVGLPGQLAIAAAQARKHNAIAVFWLDLARADQFYLYLSGYESDRVLVRQLGGMTGEGLAEALALIVRTTVDEMLSGGRIGVESVKIVDGSNEAMKVEEITPPVPTPQPRQVFLLEMAYVYTAVSEKTPVEHGLFLGLGLSPTNQLWVRVSYTVFQPIVVKGDLSDLRIMRHPLGLGLALDVPFRRITISPELGLIVDLVTMENFNLASGMNASSDRTDIDVAATAALRADFSITDTVKVFVRVAAWVSFVQKEYVADGHSSRELLHQPFRVCPVAMAGLSIRLP